MEQHTMANGSTLTWPLTGNAWGAQMLFLVQNGYRVIAHDRRGHGRVRRADSDHPWR
jgi:non-heme chloroperoxidase